MQKKILLFVISVIVTSCVTGPSIKRFDYLTPEKKVQPNSKDLSSIKIVKNGTGFDEKTKLGTIQVYDNGVSTKCSESDVKLLLKTEAFNIGANVINLYNIQEPSFWGSTCFQTFADFYKIDDEIQIVKEDSKLDSDRKLTTDSNTSKNDKSNYPIVSSQVKKKKTINIIQQEIKIDTIQNSGHEVRVNMEVGFVSSGDQLTVAEKGLNPKPDGVNRLGYGIKYIYWGNLLGLNLEYLYSNTRAVKADYEPLTIYNQSIFRAGALLTPYTNMTQSGLHRIYFNLGVNYDYFSFSSNTDLYNMETLKGLGYFAFFGYDFISISKFIIGFNLGYEVKNPTNQYFKRPYDSEEIIIGLTLGYKF